MNYILAIIAFFSYLGVKTADMTTNQQIFAYLNTLAGVESTFFKIVAGLVVLGIILAAVWRKDGGLGCGCQLAGVAIVIFICTGFAYLLTQGMISGFDPSTGVTDPIKFYVCLAFFILTGLG